MSGSCSEALPGVREWSGGRSRGPRGLVDVREALLDVWEWSGGPFECLGLAGMPSWMSGSDWEALSDVREWSGIYPGCPGAVGRPSRMSGSGREALPDVRLLS